MMLRSWVGAIGDHGWVEAEVWPDKVLVTLDNDSKGCKGSVSKQLQESRWEMILLWIKKMTMKMKRSDYGHMGKLTSLCDRWDIENEVWKRIQGWHTLLVSVSLWWWHREVDGDDTFSLFVLNTC
jgi:hypothetical protein